MFRSGSLNKVRGCRAVASFSILASCFLFNPTFTATAEAGTTHMGQLPTTHIVLKKNLASGLFVGVPTDGTINTDTDFFVKEGEALVITDVDLFLDGGKKAANEEFFIGFLARNRVDPFPGQPFVLTVAGTFNRQGFFSQNIAMTTGFVVYPGIRIDLSLSWPAFEPQGIITLRGYLVSTINSPE